MNAHYEKLRRGANRAYVYGCALITADNAKRGENRADRMAAELGARLEDWINCPPMESYACGAAICTQLVVASHLRAPLDATVRAIINTLRHHVPDPDGVFICECQEHEHAARCN